MAAHGVYSVYSVVYNVCIELYIGFFLSNFDKVLQGFTGPPRVLGRV